MGGSGAGGESPDTELTVNEVADLVEKLGGEAIETEIVTVDETSMNEMETNDNEDTEEETVVVKEVVKDDDSVVEPTPEPPHVPIVEPVEAEKPEKDVKCKKCARSSWRARHEEFCENQCGKNEVMEPVVEEENVAQEVPAEDGRVEEVVEEAVDEEIEEAVEEAVEEVVQEIVDGEVTAIESEEVEDPKHRKKCERCSKKGFYKRHKEFCDNDCDDSVVAEPTEEEPTEEETEETEEVEEVENVEEETSAMTDEVKKKCGRCTKARFARKNTEFCQDTCNLDDVAAESESTNEVVKEENKSEETEESSSSNASEKRRRNKHKKKKDKKNKNKNKPKKKKNDNDNDDERNNKVKVDNDNDNTKPNKPNKKLGPLENLIKLLIKRNTFNNR